MDLSMFGTIISKMYTDKMSFSRHLEVTNEDGTTGISLEPVPIAEDVACRLSFSASDSSDTKKEENNPLNVVIKIFCSPEVTVQKGDNITVKRLKANGEVVRTFTGIANMSSMYSTHQEIIFTETGDA